jgi:hypothetical protein
MGAGATARGGGHRRHQHWSGARQITPYLKPKIVAFELEFLNITAGEKLKQAL